MALLATEGNAQIWYQDQGQGDPVLFVHGWCMSSAVWRCQQEAIAAQYRFLAIDLRGHGRSTLPASGINGFAAYADDIVALVEALDLQKLTLVGWSMGAQAVLKAWPRINSRIKGLVLVGATPRFTAAPHFPYGLAHAEAEGMRLKVRRNLGRALEGFHRRMFVEQELQDAAQIHTVQAVLDEVPPPSTAVALDGLDSLMAEEVMQEAAAVTCPTLLLHGEQDPVCLPAASVWLAQTVQDSRRISYPGCGHAPFLSRPATFNHDLLQFIGQVHGDD